MKEETREKIKCIECQGSGKVYAGHNLDTCEAYPEAACHECNGSGVDPKKACEYIKCLESEIANLESKLEAIQRSITDVDEDKDFEP